MCSDVIMISSDSDDEIIHLPSDRADDIIQLSSDSDCEIIEIKRRKRRPKKILLPFQRADTKEDSKEKKIVCLFKKDLADSCTETEDFLENEEPCKEAFMHKHTFTAVYKPGSKNRRRIFDAVMDTYIQDSVKIRFGDEVEELKFPASAIGCILHSIYHFLPEEHEIARKRNNFKAKKLKNSFLSSPYKPPTKRTLLSNRYGRDKLPVYFDTRDSTLEKDRRRLSELIYLRRNVIPKELCISNPSGGQKRSYKCDCQFKKGTECPCIGNSDCGCWSYSEPRLNNVQCLPFHQVQFGYSLVFICGKECACKGKCGNNFSLSRSRFQMELFENDPQMGFEVRAKEFILPGEFVMPFLGEVVTEEQLARSKDPQDTRYSLELSDPTCSPTMEINTLKKRLFINPARKGNVARYISHSCLPNLVPIRVLRNSQYIQEAVIMMVACEPIPTGHVLSFDYGSRYVNQFFKDNCLCRSPNCLANEKKDISFTFEEIAVSYRERLFALMKECAWEVGVYERTPFDEYYRSSGQEALAKKYRNLIDKREKMASNFIKKSNLKFYM